MNTRRHLLKLVATMIVLLIGSNAMSQTTSGDKPLTGVKPTAVANVKTKAKVKATKTTSARAKASRAQAQARYNNIFGSYTQSSYSGNFSNTNQGGFYGGGAYAPFAVAGGGYSQFNGVNGYGNGYGLNGYGSNVNYPPQYSNSTPAITPDTTLFGGANVGTPVQGGIYRPGYGVSGISSTPVHGGTLVPGYGVIKLK